MSFKIINLTPLQNGKNGKVPCIWTFWNEDDDTLTTEGFFPKNCGLKNGDQVIAISDDYKTRTDYYVSVDSDGVITLTANTTPTE